MGDQFDPHTQSPITQADRQTSEPNRETRSLAWETFQATLAELEAQLDGFPPLKVIVGGLRMCVMNFKPGENDRAEHDITAFNLADIAKHLKEAIRPQSKIPRQIGTLLRELKRLVVQVKLKQERYGIIRSVVGSQDEQSVTKMSTHVYDSETEQQLITLASILLPVANAEYDANVSVLIGFERNGCMPGTRLLELGEVSDWALNVETTGLYWITGEAGSGKTTVAYSVCEQLERAGLLGASFFCSPVSQDCQDVYRIIPSLAYQLARSSRTYRDRLLEITLNTDGNAMQSIEAQFGYLIAGPLSGIKPAEANILVVIDALDECFDDTAILTFQHTLLHFTMSLPIKLLATSRNGPQIVTPSPKIQVAVHQHDLGRLFAQSDIELYLSSMLSTMTLNSQDIRRLSARIGGRFSLATTVVRYILPEGHHADSAERLSRILDLESSKGKEGAARVDTSYLAILSHILGDKKGADKFILRQMLLQMVARTPRPLTMAKTQVTLGLENRRDLFFIIKSLNCLLYLNNLTGTVSLFESSFSDFILDSTRAGAFYCSQSKLNEYLALQSFRVQNRLLRFNICDLQTSSCMDNEVSDLKGRVERAIPDILWHACCSWGNYLEGSEVSERLVTCLKDFILDRLLFWMEVMNLRCQIALASVVLGQAQCFLEKGTDFAGLLSLVKEAQIFVNTYASSPVSHSTPHIYISALPLASRRNSGLREIYWPRTLGLFNIQGTIRGRDETIRDIWALDSNDATWDISHLALDKLHWGSDPVVAAALSPNGTKVISGSSNHSICIWDTHHGALLIGPITGHTNWVNSVVYSPNGLCVVSGSDDGTIRTWDVQNGKPLTSALAAHRGRVLSVTISSDGSLIASGSADCSIRLWDLKEGSQLGPPIVGHSHWVQSVAFSPDDTHLVSGSDDKSVRVWDLNVYWKGLPITFFALKGHTATVRSTKFSPDGRKVVSASDDRTIIVWDVVTGRVIGKPISGHTGSVWTALFTPDGQNIVSGADDGTVCLWDANTGKLVAPPFTGHLDTVYMVNASRDGSWIVSSSHDGTIRCWQLPGADVEPKPYDFTIGVDGWVKDSDSQLVLWLPPALRAIFPKPPCSLIIHDHGSIGGSFLGLFYGKDWWKCYPDNQVNIHADRIV